jgi:hypothetical protein
MSRKSTPEAPDRKSFSLTSWILWSFVALMCYVLSTGPLMRMADSKYFEEHAAFGDFVEKAYFPVEWAYEETLLHRPLGMYFHLWSSRFDAKGDEK